MAIVFGADAPSVSAQRAILADENGTVLYEKCCDDRSLIASTTKLMTALIVDDCCTLEETAAVSYAAAAVEGSSVYLEPGAEVSVKELLSGLLVASGNDAAYALAEHAAGSVEAFVALMNAKAAQLGMYNTHFTNPHGLDNAEHYSSARDLAILMSEFLRHESLTELCAQKSTTVCGNRFDNHNKLLSMCSGCIAGKTGYTMAAGRCLVSCCEREGRRLICVTLSDGDDWNDHISLYDWGFEQLNALSG